MSAEALMLGGLLLLAATSLARSGGTRGSFAGVAPGRVASSQPMTEDGTRVAD
jgi:hypothetical protein